MKAPATCYFPRAIHRGEGSMRPIPEPAITGEQGDEVLFILTGEDQPPGTMFQIARVIVETHHEPIRTR
ncbi:hypothetical protein Ga0609869_003242 [Rhodovulum iodosum]|uniref:Uncharacterized protein n=1 Tax=Rhodovulum iodosum TaxID=68291 RepID=A0ABV3XXV0_9RHOB|nr:hypothetical protein [Rhodovulum robiginosum]RSK34077.1 hypothetical protein EJA01_08080 [Rhodovulum robiginosum]